MFTRLSWFVCAFTLWCATAVAQGDAPASTLTDRGRSMLAGQVSGFWSNDKPALNASYPTWTVRADPALTYFFWKNIGLGAALTGSYAGGEPLGGGHYRERALGALTEFVWNAPLGGRLSLMLRCSLGYLYSWADLSVTGALGGVGPGAVSEMLTRQLESRHAIRTALALPLVYALSASVGLGAGPTLNYDYGFRATREWPGSSQYQRFRPSRLQVGVSVAVYASF